MEKSDVDVVKKKFHHGKVGRGKGTKEYEVLTKKPMLATKEETNINLRARSSRLRVLQRNGKICCSVCFVFL
jgi:16S rRNA C1402 N4-methylase RsmH